MFNLRSILQLVLFCSLNFLLLIPAEAQDNKGTLSGTVVDSAGVALEKASVSLLHAKDSSIASSVLTSENGQFNISGIIEGKYLLYISYLGYQQTTRSLSFTKEKLQQNLGKIFLEKAFVSLSEITVEQSAPPLRISGDTLDFNAGSFKTKPNAVVEDLLKKIPGIEVEPDGTIKSEGEEITQILVDGKPFFGNDPKIATKNLPSDIIERVQIYDKKSDQAEFTGVDDGDEKKAINLKVKKDRKKGTFGKAEAGAGTENRYSTGVNLFRFNDNQQISFVGNGNNINQRNFSFRRFGGGRGGTGNGNVTSWMGGVNYRDNWGDKIEVNGDYFFNYNDRADIRQQQTEYILPDTSYYKDQNQNSWNQTNNHRFNMRIDYKIDSMNSLLFRPSISYNTNRNSNTSEYHSNDKSKLPINKGVSEYAQSAYSPDFSGSVLYRRRFHKKGRTFSLQLNGGTSYTHSDGYNKQKTTLFEGDIAEDSTINQEFRQKRDRQNWGVRISYTEPLSDSRILEIHLAHNNNLNNSDKKSYNQDPDNKAYNVLDSAYSNAFKNSFGAEQAGINIQTKKEDFDYTVGLNIRKNNLYNYSITGDSSFSQNTLNYFPEARFNYNFSRTKRLKIAYRGNTGQPSINQLQPVPDNSQSLSKVIGNPDLKPYFSHSLQMNYRNFNRENHRMFFARLNMTTTMNEIVNATEYQKGGKQIIHYENTNGNYNLNGSVTAGLPLNNSTNMINSSTSFSYRKNASFINKQRSEAKNLRISERLSLNFSHKELLNFRIGGNIGYNNVSYTLQKSQNTSYFSYGGTLDFNLNLPAHFELETDFRYHVNTGLSAGFNQNVAMWNASVSKYILKDQKARLKLAAYDLLNQQINISRNITAQYIRDVRTNVIPQYFLLSFTYFINKFPGGEQGGAGRGMRRPHRRF